MVQESTFWLDLHLFVIGMSFVLKFMVENHDIEFDVLYTIESSSFHCLSLAIYVELVGQILDFFEKWIENLGTELGCLYQDVLS